MGALESRFRLPPTGGACTPRHDIGHPVRDPVLLDGAGGVLPDAEPEVYLRYGVYHSRDWTPLNLDFDTGPDWLPWIADIVVGDANAAQKALIEFEG